jgi:Domain of unknown function (DUF4345)
VATRYTIAGGKWSDVAEIVVTGPLIRATLRFLLAVLGVTALLIALSNLLLGPSFTAGAAERAFDAFTGWQGPSSAPWQPTMDNELRFYSALWGGYGIAMLATARHLDAYLRFVPWLAVVFFVGGVGRAISWAQVGAPHPLFLNPMATELIAPPIFLLLYVRARMATTANSK